MKINLAKYEEIPTELINCFWYQRTNFYNHIGIDIKGIFRAFKKNHKTFSNKRPEGASTITQQVAKTFY